MLLISGMVFRYAVLVLSIAVVSLNLTACSEDEAVNDMGSVSLFNQTTWKAQSGSQEADNPRAMMVADLKANHLRTGMTRSEVEVLLGKADRERNGQYLYRLGMGKYSADYSYLALVFDENGKLKEIVSTRS